MLLYQAFGGQRFSPEPLLADTGCHLERTALSL